jgi:hypothetical protein
VAKLANRVRHIGHSTGRPESLILDIGNEDRIVGIEILDASKRPRLDRFLPVQYQKTA